MPRAGSTLRYVDLIDPAGNPTPGLVAVGLSSRTNLTIDERAAIIDAGLLGGIDYVFFRRFSDGRSSQISAYVVDNSKERLDEEELAELHLRVWLNGKTPLLYIAWPDRVDVLTCARGPDFWADTNKEYRYNPVKRLQVETLEAAGTIASELKRFSALRLADGTFWEEPDNRHLADYAKAAHQRLIQAIVETDNDLDGENNPVSRRLLLLMVLVKYLEDRRVFPDSWFSKFRKGANSFFEVLQGGEPDQVHRLLDSLEQKFDGDLFSLQRQSLTRAVLETFARLVEARTLNRQGYLWRQFSFEHLPVEVISHLYQRFVRGGHGAVYTPPLLAALLLDHVMPYETLTGRERVLDAACGSGVFLVGAFRRLINVWRNRNRWERPDVQVLKSIVKNSIYGIELDQNAIDLTAFSLSLAICDALQPDVIWKELKFDLLRKSNLLEDDFFRILVQHGEDKRTIAEDGFDIVVGNPPFESKLSHAASEINRNVQRLDSTRRSLPDNQVAYLFLEQTLSVLRPGGRMCLIQPAGLLYNLNAQAFRSNLFKRHKISTVFDFTSIRQLYGQADPKTIAVLAHNEPPPEGHIINHWTFRRTASVAERICFELDHYDRHRISQPQVESDPYVWRVNLLGGGRLIDISRRLRQLRTLSEYVKQKGWDYGEGYIAAKTGRRIRAEFLVGKPLLPTEAFTNHGIEEDKIEVVKETRFRSPYTQARFSPPLILLKETDSLPIAFWDKSFLAYRHKIIGIHAPQEEVGKLRELYETIRQNHEIYRFCGTLNGSQSLVGKATAILKQDIDLLPYPERPAHLCPSFWERALAEDVLDYMADYVRLGQNSKLMTTASGTNHLAEYSQMFLRMLGSVYSNMKIGDAVFMDGLICQPFYFGERDSDLSWLNEGAAETLRNIVYDDERHKYLRTIRLLRFYDGNVLLLIKPHLLRYWIRSTAIRDADETLLDLRQWGY